MMPILLVAGAGALNGVMAAAWWPSLSGVLRGGGGRAAIGVVTGATWALFVERYAPMASDTGFLATLGMVVAGLWVLGAVQWGYRSTYLWMVAVNLPLGTLHWPMGLIAMLSLLVTGRGAVGLADGVLLWIAATGLWTVALRMMIVSRESALPPARRANVRKLYAWLSHTPVWPPPPMPEELPPSEIMEDVEGGWVRFLDQQAILTGHRPRRD